MNAKKQSQKAFTRALVLVAVALIAVVNLLPVIWGVLTSIKTEQGVLVSPPEFWGFETTSANYSTVLNGSFSQGIVTSLFYATITTVLGIFIGSLSAFALDRLRFRGKSVIFYTIVGCVPLSIGASILAVPNYMYFSALGMLDKWYTLPIIYLALNLPLATWVIKGSVEAVPKEIDQSAKLDGLSNTGVLFRIVLPLCRPGMFAAGMLIFIGSWNEFIFGTILVRSADLKPVQVGVYQYISAFGRAWAPLTAAATLAVIPILILLFILGRNLVAGLMRGAVKG